MKQYDPNKVIIQYGTFTFSAFAAEQMCKAIPASDRRGIHEGVDGKARHVKFQSKSGTIELPLADYSPGNAFMSAADIADLDTKFSVIDKTSEADLFISPSVTVRRHPDFEKGKNPSERAWILQYTDGEYTFGGGAE